jgi:arylsulfatase A-like enzyme
MTGRRPSTTGVYLLGNFHFRKSPAIEKGDTLPEYFAKAGYRTLGAGKVYHNHTGMGTFQTYGPGGNFGPRPKQKLNYPKGHPLWDWGPYPETTEKQMPDYQVASWAIKQLKKDRDQPFFMAAGFFRPHVPMYVPKRYWDRLPPVDQIKLPPTKADDRADLSQYAKQLTAGFPAPRQHWFEQHPPQWRKAVKSYLASTTFADAQAGRVLKALRQSQYAKNTIVVLLSDHGFALGEKRRWAKRSLWERSTQVPLIVAGAGLPQGQRCHQPVGLIDIFPTLQQLCDLPNNPKLAGTSFLPQLQDPQTPREPTFTTFWVDNHAVRSRNWRLIQYASGDMELYNHQRDPNEWHNRLHKQSAPSVVETLKTHLPPDDASPIPGSRALGVAEKHREKFNVPN